MNTTAFAITLLFKFLKQCLANFFCQKQPQNQAVSTEFRNHRTETATVPTPQTASYKPVRVVQVFDSHHTNSSMGRIVISGRMADVCAELDRLAALEAA